MLNSKGRHLFDLFLYRESSDHDAVLVDCPAQSSAKLLSLLQKFKLRSSVDMDDASQDFRVVAAWNTSATKQHTQGVHTSRRIHAVQGLFETLVIMSNSEVGATGDNSLAGMLHTDPRLVQLGLRGPLASSSSQEALSDDEMQYIEHRYMHGVPEGSVEIPSGAFPGAAWCHVIQNLPCRCCARWACRPCHETNFP